MAEVSGLVIGAIALGSLFSTCVDSFDRFELGRNYAYDYQLACTKLSLLRVRLSSWGAALNVDDPGHENPALCKRWRDEQAVIARSLFGIKNIFENAALLQTKYDLLPKRSHSHSHSFKSVFTRRFSRTTAGDQPLTRRPPPPPPPPPRNVSSTSLTLLRQRTVWAIHDKQKFDGFIADLSFLIENLEKVAERIARASPDPTTPTESLFPARIYTPSNQPGSSRSINTTDFPLRDPPTKPDPYPSPTKALMQTSRTTMSTTDQNPPKKDQDRQPLGLSQEVLNQIALSTTGDIIINHEADLKGSVNILGSVGQDAGTGGRKLIIGTKITGKNTFNVLGNVSEGSVASLVKWPTSSATGQHAGVEQSPAPRDVREPSTGASRGCRLGVPVSNVHTLSDYSPMSDYSGTSR